MGEGTPLEKPVIGITVHIEEDNKHYLHPDYIRAITESGGLPLLIPIGVEQDLEQLSTMIDGLLLTGGDDIDPAEYGEEPHPKLDQVVAERDGLELPLIEHVLRHDKPILGICRGEQIINVALGGTLYQDIETQYEHVNIQHLQHAKRSHPSHEVVVSKHTILESIVKKDKIKVNSFHHQAVRRIAESLIVSGTSHDGIIEAIESPTYKFVLGVQWHPETLAVNGNVIAKRLFERFVNESKRLES